MNSLKLRIQDDMKTCMKAGEKVKLGVIRLILAAIKQREVDERIQLDDEQVLLVLDKMVKQRRDSVNQYSLGNREDLAQIERAEIEIIQEYLPKALSEDEIEAMVQEAITESKALIMSDMGKVMALLKPKMQGRADMAKVSAKIKNKLNS